MLSLFSVLVEVEYESFGEGFFQYVNFCVVLAWRVVPFHLQLAFSNFFYWVFPFCFNSSEYILSLENLLGSFLL